MISDIYQIISSWLSKTIKSKIQLSTVTESAVFKRRNSGGNSTIK